MIHSAVVEVTCDGDCTNTEYVELDYVYNDYSGKSGQYDSRDSTIEDNLVTHLDWTVIDGKHYCTLECVKEPTDG